MLERTLVFVDTSYLLASFYNSWEEGARGQLEISLATVVQRIDQQARALVDQPVQRQNWYDGIPDSGPHRYQRTLRVIEGVQLRAGQLIEWGDRRTQKAVDTLLVADMIQAAYRGQCSDMVLVSGDADMIPAVRVAVDAGVRVHLIGFGWDSISSALRHACDSATVLDPREDFEDAMQIRVLEGPIPPQVRRQAARPAAPGAEPDEDVDPGEDMVPVRPRSETRASAMSVADESRQTAADEERAADMEESTAEGTAEGASDGASDGTAEDAAEDAADGTVEAGGAGAAEGSDDEPVGEPVETPPARTAPGASTPTHSSPTPSSAAPPTPAPTSPGGPAPRSHPARPVPGPARRPRPAGPVAGPTAGGRAAGSPLGPAAPAPAGTAGEPTPPDGSAVPSPAEAAARPKPSMMAPHRRPLRNKFVPLSDEVWTSSGEQTPHDVGRQYATWWFEKAASEEQRDTAHLLSGGALPPEIDRPLLQFACQMLNEFTLGEEQRVRLRDGFHEGIRTVLTGR